MARYDRRRGSEGTDDVIGAVYSFYRDGEFQRSVHGPVMMTGANTVTDRWRLQDARRGVVVVRTRGDQCRADREP
jgi:hypothetical protein